MLHESSAFFLPPLFFPFFWMLLTPYIGLQMIHRTKAVAHKYISYQIYSWIGFPTCKCISFWVHMMLSFGWCSDPNMYSGGWNICHVRFTGIKIQIKWLACRAPIKFTGKAKKLKFAPHISDTCTLLFFFSESFIPSIFYSHKPYTSLNSTHHMTVTDMWTGEVKK